MGTIIMFPHNRLIGLARQLVDMSETRTDAEMDVIWNTAMDELEERMSVCGFGLEEWTVQIPALYCLVRGEKLRREYEYRWHGPDEAA